MALDFTVTEIRHINENLPAPPTPANKLNSDRDGSIGCKMRLELDVLIEGDIGPGGAVQATVSSTRWYFNPALWQPSALRTINTYANVNYAVEIPNGPAAGSEWPMDLQAPALARESCRNMSCKLKIRDSENATIILSYRHTMDMGNFITGASVNNHARFLKNHQTAPAELANTIGSAYSDYTRKIGWRLEVEDGYGVALYKYGSTPYRSRFYALGTPGAGMLGVDPPLAAETNGQYGGTVYTGKMYRGGVEVSALSVYEKTLVVFSFDDAQQTAFHTSAMVYVIDRTNTAAGVDYLTNYDSAGVTINTNPASVLVAEKIFAPTQVGVVDSGRRLVSFYVGTDLDAAHEYGIILVLPAWPDDDVDNGWTNSYILPTRADGLPSPVPMPQGSIGGTVQDYNVDPLTDNVRSTTADHVRCIARVNTQVYDDGAADAKFASNWLNDMRRIVTEIVDADTGDVLFTRQFSRTMAGLWVPVGGASDNVIIETLVSPGVREYSVFVHLGMQNIGGLVDMGGLNLFHRWNFIAFYSPSDWSVFYRYDQGVSVKAFAEFSEVVQSIRLLDFATGLPINSLCGITLVNVEVTLNETVVDFYAGLGIGLDGWNIRVKWQIEPYGYPGSEQARPAGAPEHEAYTSPPGFDQLEDELFDAVDAVVNGTTLVETFSFDVSGFQPGQKVRLYVIVEPIQEVTEDPCAGVAQFPEGIIEADFQAFSNERAIWEGLAGMLTIGDTIYLADHIGSFPLPTTDAWEQHTGCSAVYVGAGAGEGGGMWDYVEHDDGDIIQVLSYAGQPEEYWINVTQAGTTLYTDNAGTGKFGLYYFAPVASLDPGPPSNTTLMLVSVYTGASSNRLDFVEECRTFLIETSAVGIGGPWVQTDEPANPLSEADTDNWTGGPGFLVDYTPPVDYQRVAWYRGGILQGYSLAMISTV